MDVTDPIPSYLDLIDDAPEPAWPIGAGRWEVWKWKRARRGLEYDLFVMDGAWGSVQWNIVKAENDVLGVWRGRWNCAGAWGRWWKRRLYG